MYLGKEGFYAVKVSQEFFTGILFFLKKKTCFGLKKWKHACLVSSFSTTLVLSPWPWGGAYSFFLLSGLPHYVLGDPPVPRDGPFGAGHGPGAAIAPVGGYVVTGGGAGSLRYCRRPANIR